MLVPDLPAELWEAVLARAGPLALAPYVRARGRECAAARVQRRWRARRAALYPGRRVRVTLHDGGPVLHGVIFAWGDPGEYGVRVADPERRRYLFLPRAGARVVPA